MTKYIALLRGINLGNRNKVLMADLRELFGKMGYSDIKTYIQTGNVVFSSDKSENNDDLSSRIEKEILSTFGFEVPVIIKTKKELKDLISNNPFIKDGISDIERLHMTFLKDIPQENELEEINKLTNISNNDRFKIIDKSVFVYCSNLYLDTKFGNSFFERKLKVKASTRNWKTVLRINELLA